MVYKLIKPSCLSPLPLNTSRRQLYDSIHLQALLHNINPGAH